MRCVFRFTFAARLPRRAGPRRRGRATTHARLRLGDAGVRRDEARLGLAERRGKRLLKRPRSLKVSLTVTERQGGPATTVLKHTLSFRASGAATG